MKFWKSRIGLGAVLLVLSAVFYILHYLLFRDLHHIFLYLIGDIAFVFVEVLLVTLIIHQVLEEREKRARMEKSNMVIGAFFSEVGNRLLEMLSTLDPAIEDGQQHFSGQSKSGGEGFSAVADYLREHDCRLNTAKAEWSDLKEFLVNKRGFMLGLLENPNLLEHESFTDVLWAVFHLTEELAARKTLTGLPDADYRHLGGDMNRAYGRLAGQWLEYMEHLRDHYPYLFSLALRTNPFNHTASPVVRE